MNYVTDLTKLHNYVLLGPLAGFIMKFIDINNPPTPTANKYHFTVLTRYGNAVASSLDSRPEGYPDYRIAKWSAEVYINENTGDPISEYRILISIHPITNQ